MLYFVFCSWCSLIRQPYKKKYPKKRNDNIIYDKKCYSFANYM